MAFVGCHSCDGLSLAKIFQYGKMVQYLELFRLKIIQKKRHLPPKQVFTLKYEQALCILKEHSRFFQPITCRK